MPANDIQTNHKKGDRGFIIYPHQSQQAVSYPNSRAR